MFNIILLEFALILRRINANLFIGLNKYLKIRVLITQSAVMKKLTLFLVLLIVCTTSLLAVSTVPKDSLLAHFTSYIDMNLKATDYAAGPAIRIASKASYFRYGIVGFQMKDIAVVREKIEIGFTVYQSTSDDYFLTGVGDFPLAVYAMKRKPTFPVTFNSFFNTSSDIPAGDGFVVTGSYPKSLSISDGQKIGTIAVKKTDKDSFVKLDVTDFVNKNIDGADSIYFFITSDAVENGTVSLWIRSRNFDVTSSPRLFLYDEKLTTEMTGGKSLILGEKDSVYITFPPTAIPPFSMTYTDGATQMTINNITRRNFAFEVAPTATVTYTILASSDANGSIPVNGSARFEVTDNSSPDIKLTNARYELSFRKSSNTFDIKELKSNVVRTFSPGFNVVYKSAKPAITMTDITQDFNYSTVSFGGSNDLFSTNAGGFTVRGTPTSVTESNGVISLVYQDNASYTLTAKIYLPAGNEEPVIESSLKALAAGYFSVGYYGAPELDRSEIKELFQPLPFTGLRVPASSYLTPAFLCTLPGTFLTIGSITYGVFADPAEFPFSPLPVTLARSPFGVAVRNKSGVGKELKPMVWAPIIGNNDSYLAVNSTKRFKFRPYVTMGSITTAYEDIARRQFGFGNFRNNDLGSLNKTMDRMIDYGMTTQWGIFKEDMKGCSYDTDVPNSVKNTSALPMYATAFITDRVDVYEKRALPVLEFMLSRENTMYSPEDTSGAGGQAATNSLGSPCMSFSEMLSFYNITNKQMGVMLPLAYANKKGSLSSSEITLKENFSLYRATQQASTLSELITGVDKYIAEEITVKPTDFLYINHQKNSFWTSIAPKFVELYEIYKTTGNPTYLQAARNAARIYAYHIWMSPKVTPGDSVLCNVGNIAPRYRGTGNISIPEEKAPAWRLSEMGLHCEAGGTSTSKHRAVFTANFAGYLLRIGSLTKDSFLLDLGKAAVIGRYTNFPGYHINTDRTTVYEKPNFPLRTLTQLTSTSMHYSHVWTQINLMFDYLVSDVAARTLGAVDFPGQYVQNIVHMQNQVYMTGGKFYGDENLTLWMPKDILQTANEQLNYITAYGNGKFYIVFTNQSGQTVNTSVTLNSSLVNVSGKSYSQWNENTTGQGGTISTNSFNVSVAPHGVTAIAINDVNIVTKFQQKLAVNTIKNKWNKYYESNIPLGKSKSMLLNLSDSLARLFVFSTDAKGTHTLVKLQYSLNKGAWQELTDNLYPFEFSVDINTATSVDYKVVIGSTVSTVYTYERLKPTAVMSGWTSIKKADGAVLPIELTGTPPFEITYSENNDVVQVAGIQDSMYLLGINPQTTSYYKILSMKDGSGTAGEVSGDAKVVVVDAYQPVSTVVASKDAQTYKALATKNYGADQQLELKGSATYRRDLFYTFVVPQVTLDEHQRALINLWINQTSRLDVPYLTTHIKATKFSDEWQESLITWNIQPALTNAEVLDTIAVSYLTSIPGFITLDITRLIRQGFSGTLNLKIDYLKGEDVASIYIASKEQTDDSKYPHFAIVEPMQTSNSQLSLNNCLLIVPNVVKDYFEIKGDIVPEIVLIYDCTGKQLLRVSNSAYVKTSMLSAGIYQVIVRDASQQIYRSKIIKQD